MFMAKKSLIEFFVKKSFANSGECFIKTKYNGKRYLVSPDFINKLHVFDIENTDSDFIELTNPREHSSVFLSVKENVVIKKNFKIFL